MGEKITVRAYLRNSPDKLHDDDVVTIPDALAAAKSFMLLSEVREVTIEAAGIILHREKKGLFK